MQKLQSQGVHHITIVGADRQTSIDLWEGVLGIVDRHVIPTAVSGRAIGGTGGKVSLGGYFGVLIAGPVSRCHVPLSARGRVCRHAPGGAAGTKCGCEDGGRLVAHRHDARVRRRRYRG